MRTVSVQFKKPDYKNIVTLTASFEPDIPRANVTGYLDERSLRPSPGSSPPCDDGNMLDEIVTFYFVHPDQHIHIEQISKLVLDKGQKILVSFMQSFETKLEIFLVRIK